MKRSVLILVAVLIIGILAFFMFLKVSGDPTAYTQLEQNVEQYLIEEQNYAPDEIQSIEVVRVAMKAPGYYAEVVFTDEPDTTYFYCEAESGHVVQCGERETATSGEASNFKRRES